MLLAPSSNLDVQNELKNFQIASMRNSAQNNAAILHEKEDIIILNLEKLPLSKRPQDISFLQPEFKAEALAESFITKKYLTAEQRKQQLVTVEHGVFKSSNGVALWGEYIYGLLPDGRLYADIVGNRRHHSEILGGLPAKAVGHAHFINGSLVTLSNNSGHYKPTAQKMQEGIKWFYQHSLNDFLFEDHSNYMQNESDHGLRFCKASEIVASKNAAKAAKPYLRNEINKLITDLIDTILRTKSKIRMLDKENIKQNESATKGLCTIVASVDDENDDAYEFVYSGYEDDDEATIATTKIEHIHMNGSAQQDLTNLQYTSLLKTLPSRFMGVKNLARFKAKK